MPSLMQIKTRAAKVANLKSNGFVNVSDCNPEMLITMTNTIPGHEYENWVATVSSDGKVNYTKKAAL